MMPVPSEATAYITTVGEDHLIAVPESVPTGATVAVVIVSPAEIGASVAKLEEEVRQSHFAAVMEAIRAVASKPAPADQYTDAELDTLIEQARKATRPHDVNYRLLV